MSSPGVVCPALEQSEALQELFTSNLKLGLPTACQAAKQLLVLLYQQGSSRAKQGLVALIKERVLYCIHHHRSLDVASSMQQELGLLTELVTGGSNADAQAWQSQMLLLFQLLLPATGNSRECFITAASFKALLSLESSKHLHNVEMRFCFPKMFLSIDFQCRDDISGWNRASGLPADEVSLMHHCSS